MFEALTLARDDGRHERVPKTIARMEVRTIDDWGLAVLTAPKRRDLLEILEDRHGRATTIVTSQLPVEHWHEAIGDPTPAEAIPDRLVHNAHRLKLAGESMRKAAARNSSLDLSAKARLHKTAGQTSRPPSRGMAAHDAVEPVTNVRGMRSAGRALPEVLHGFPFIARDLALSKNKRPHEFTPDRVAKVNDGHGFLMRSALGFYYGKAFVQSHPAPASSATTRAPSSFVSSARRWVSTKPMICAPSVGVRSPAATAASSLRA